MTFLVEPPAVFGLPEDGRTVVPAGGEHSAAVLATGTDQFVAHGSLSVYRAVSEAIQVDLAYGGVLISIRDNFLTVSVEAEDRDGAWQTATGLVESFMQHLSLALGRRMTARGVVIELPDGRNIRAPWTISLASVTTYNLEQLRAALDDAATFGSLSDNRLARALDYYELGLMLYEERAKLASPMSRQHHELIASVFLNLWKAATAVVGDPSADRDHQSRYRGLGLDFEFFTEKINGSQTCVIGMMSPTTPSIEMPLRKLRASTAKQKRPSRKFSAGTALACVTPPSVI